MAINGNSKTRYFTKDTLLATWLYMSGIRLDGVSLDDTNSCHFIFAANQEELNDLISQFQEGNPYGNIITFFRSYKHLLSQIKDK